MNSVSSLSFILTTGGNTNTPYTQLTRSIPLLKWSRDTEFPDPIYQQPSTLLLPMYSYLLEDTSLHSPQIHREPE